MRRHGVMWRYAVVSVAPTHVSVAVHGNLDILKRRRRGWTPPPSLRVRDGPRGFPRAVVLPIPPIRGAVSAVASLSSSSMSPRSALGTAVRGRRPAAPRQAARRAVGLRIVQREVLRAPRRSRRRYRRRGSLGGDSLEPLVRSQFARGRSLRRVLAKAGRQEAPKLGRYSRRQRRRLVADDGEERGHRLKVKVRRRTGEQLDDDARHGPDVALGVALRAAHLDHLRRHPVRRPDHVEGGVVVDRSTTGFFRSVT
mmetsp:Transcript_9968/g.45116  ORF Transcript_9968/g.45116 Transcript_9968/m.45116 type:complete len:254 (-) Transcript_9968:614-1375(-)